MISCSVPRHEPVPLGLHVTHSVQLFEQASHTSHCLQIKIYEMLYQIFAA
jgi:hypothetical protein